MGVVLQHTGRVGDAHLLQHIRRMGPGLLLILVRVQHDGLHHLPVNAHGRVQGAHGLLEDHAHAPAADGADLADRQLQQILAVQQHLPVGHLARRVLEQLHDGEAGHAFPAAGLAHQTQDLALIDLEGYLVHGGDALGFAGKELRAQLVYLQQYISLHLLTPFQAAHLILGSRVSRRPSPKRLKARTVIKMIRAGK